jgi:hypothetical protein
MLTFLATIRWFFLSSGSGQSHHGWSRTSGISPYEILFFLRLGAYPL